MALTYLSEASIVVFLARTSVYDAFDFGGASFIDSLTPVFIEGKALIDSNLTKIAE